MKNTIVWWEAVLVTTAAAVLVVSGLIPEHDYLETGLMQEQDDLDTGLMKEQDGLDVAGISVNHTGRSKHSDMEISFNQQESMAKRKKHCSPSITCTRANGYCVRFRADCNGTLDRAGCKGRKCQCCIPDHEITPTPLTCPSVTCPTVTCSSAVTTNGPTISPNLNWLNVGSDQFVRFNQKTNWTDARALCRSHGIDLYEPKDILAVSKYLDDNFSSNVDGRWYWLGAHGNGTHQVWLSGDVVTRNDPWYGNYYTKVDTEYCLYIITSYGASEKGTVLATVECNYGGNNIDVLCG